VRERRGNIREENKTREEREGCERTGFLAAEAHDALATPIRVVTVVSLDGLGRCLILPL
jgi:hypothetical protein